MTLRPSYSPDDKVGETPPGAIATVLTAPVLDALAEFFLPPTAGYRARLEAHAEVLAPVRLEAAQQVFAFAERVRDLSEADLGELFADTFGPASSQAPALGDLLYRLRLVEPGLQAGYAWRVVLPSLDRCLGRFEAERNPFVHLVRAAYCLLLPLFV